MENEEHTDDAWKWLIPTPCRWCDGSGEKLGRTCGWCDGIGTAWKPNFLGHFPRTCGEHRTVGPIRAWCYDCSEWCYASSPERGCKGCELGYEDSLPKPLTSWKVLEDRLLAADPTARERIDAIKQELELAVELHSVLDKLSQVLATLAVSNPSYAAELCEQLETLTSETRKSLSAASAGSPPGPTN